MTDTTQTKEQKLIASTALLIMPITGGCVDIYAPSLPAIAYDFSSNLTLAQLVITTYILAYGISQLPLGTLVTVPMDFCR